MRYYFAGCCRPQGKRRPFSKICNIQWLQLNVNYLFAFIFPLKVFTGREISNMIRVVSCVPLTCLQGDKEHDPNCPRIALNFRECNLER